MGYIHEVDALGRWIKLTAGLNSFRLTEAPPKVARPVVLWEAPNRRKDRHVTRYVQVRRTAQYATLYAKNLDQLADIMDKLEADLLNREGVLNVYSDGTGTATQVGILKAVEIEFNNSTNLDIPFTIRYEAAYDVTPEAAPPATKVYTKRDPNYEY